jgi:hypothetical protein
MDGLSVPIEEIGQSLLVLLFGFKGTSADGAREGPGHSPGCLARLSRGKALFNHVVNVGVVCHVGFRLDELPEDDGRQLSRQKGDRGRFGACDERSRERLQE